MLADYEDDAHFCLKCHQTIIGLDNYVDHRKAGCTKNLINPPKSPLPSQFLPPEEINLKADDFFSSLELRSSSKKPQPQPSTSGKNFSGILTRSRTSGVVQVPVTKESTETQQSKSGKNIWIGGDSLKGLGHGDNQSKLIKAVDNLETQKEEHPIAEIYEESEEDSEEFDYDDDNSSSDEDAPPRHHTGGKWKPSSPIQWSTDNRDWNIPPPSYTGGKWKPGKGKWKPRDPDEDNIPPPTFTGSKWVSSKKQTYSNPPPTHTKGKWKPREEDFPPPGHTKGKWKPREEDFPPPNYTKGKWQPRGNDDDATKPTEITSNVPESFEKEEKKIKEECESDRDYTRGKWAPSSSKPFVKITEDSLLRKSSGTVQYWCSPCNRRLASKVVYDRHLKSELHFKRTLHEGEFDDGAIIKRIKTKPPVAILEDKLTSKVKTEKKRIRKKTFERCAVCQSKVVKYLMGKHLISHYHCRKGNINSELSNKMVLENITNIAQESPYQCSICKFYFNTHEYFLQHWKSECHAERSRIHPGYFYCSFCKNKSVDSNEMYLHLTSSEHMEVVSVINRSVPIVIKKIHPAKCTTCNQEFMFNIQLINHCKKLNHMDTKLDTFIQNYCVCTDCNKIFNSNISLQRHRRFKHKDIYSFCTICDLKFENALEAENHRRSSEHRYANQINSDKQSIKKKCSYCTEAFPNFLLLKNHLKEKHPEHKVRCPHCGASFAVTQELTTHIKSKACTFEETNTESENIMRCEKCPFLTNSTAELLFHNVLHDEPIFEKFDTTESKKPIPKYLCPICEKLFPKSSLLGHIRQHTQEKPYGCNICGAKFARKNNWLFHVKNHEKTVPKKEKSKERFLCSTCGAEFGRKFILQQHMFVHTGKLCKCPKPGCTYTARKLSEIKCHYQIHSDQREYGCGMCDYKGKTKSQLKRHLTIHDDVKNYICNQCDFSARTAAHLRRHTRLHTGAKPFNCPHCKYKCNTLENLRKHVLSTNKHTGKSLYLCKFCQGNEKFQTNFAKDLKDHLISIHSDVFTKTSEATSYVAGIYEVKLDSTFVFKLEENASNKDHSNVDEESNNQDESVFVPHVVKIEEQNENALKLKTSEDPIVAQLVTPELPMFVIPKNRVNVESGGDTWNLVGRYDVEESGTLVAFHGDGDSLFQDSF